LKLKLVDVVLILLNIILLFIFRPSFGVVFFCSVSLIFMIIRRINFKKQIILRNILMTWFLVVGVSFIFIESLVISEFGTNDSQIHDIDSIVVLGAGLQGSKLSETLKQRLDASLNYISSNEAIPIILSGGQGPGEDFPEAEAMRDYIVSKGISKERITLESKSTTTEENLLFSSVILKNKGFINPRIIIVTSDYHMFRAKLIAKTVGFVAYGISSKSPLYHKINYMIREYFAIIKTFLF
jgi:uncharacterized SAM-binding protein YcdF (DUF218 family)